MVRFSIDERLAQFSVAAQTRLTPHFTAAGIAFPPRSVVLVAFKDAARLELYADGGAGLRWLRDWPILAASGGPGPKLREGDRQVPEGIYAIASLNPNSAYHVSLRLDYPNADDRARAARDGRTTLGGDIMIHGKSVSIGCLAMGDETAEELFTLAARTGLANVRVVIVPNDLRRRASKVDPPWVADLYMDLSRELAALPQQ